VTIYLDDETEHRARAAAKSRGQSLSKWFAERIRQGALSEWPDYIRGLAGAWGDAPSAQQLRKRHGRNAKRVSL
jgi:hypothetical protein